MKTHWKYHKTNAYAYFAEKIRRKTVYVSIFDDVIRFLRVLKTVLKILPIGHT